MKKLIAFYLALVILMSVCPVFAEYTDAETILAVQKALADAGIYKGNLSGIKGNATEAAIRTYQQKNGLKATGQIDDDLLDSLGLLSDEVILVSNITLNEESVSLSKGGSVTLSATVEPKNARNKKVEWSSTDESVATVKDGKVTAKANGTCDIICRAKDDSGAEAVCHVAVIVMVTSVTTTQNQKVTIPYGGSVELTATAKPADATNTTLKWTSSNESICVVDENGKVTSVGSGDCEIECSTTDGSKKFLKFQIHVPIFETLETTHVITEKGWNLIPIDLHGASAGNISHSVSSEKFFMYYFDKEGIHVYPIAEGKAQITLTSKLNKQDKIILSIAIDESAISVNGKDPLNVIIAIDHCEAQYGESCKLRYYITGGTPPYTVLGTDQRWITPNISTSSSSGKQDIRIYGSDYAACTMTVMDAAGTLCKGMSNVVTIIPALDFAFDYTYLAVVKEQPVDMPFTISGGSGSYKIDTTWNIYEKTTDTTISAYSKDTIVSNNKGVISFVPPNIASKVELVIKITDQNNRRLSASFVTSWILVTNDWSAKYTYDVRKAVPGDKASILLYVQNTTVGRIISYGSITQTKFDHNELNNKEVGKYINMKNSDWTKISSDPVIYSYSFTVRDCDTVSTNITIQLTDVSVNSSRKLKIDN